MENTSTGINTKKKRVAYLAAFLVTLPQTEIEKKLSECSFGVQTAKIIGQAVDHTGLRPPCKHTESISRMTEPASENELRFLGLKTLFAAFLDHSSETPVPLVEILQEVGLTKKRRHEQLLIVPDWNQL